MTVTEGSGHHYERQAEIWLQAQGLTPLTRNYRAKCGEIDLVMQDRTLLVFVEVKYRRRPDYGLAIEQVHRLQQLRILRAAQHYMVSLRLDTACRFDVLAITGGKELHYEWIINAFEA